MCILQLENQKSLKLSGPRFWGNLLSVGFDRSNPILCQKKDIVTPSSWVWITLDEYEARELGTIDFIFGRRVDRVLERNDRATSPGNLFAPDKFSS